MKKDFELKNFEQFASHCCSNCTSDPDGYCNSYCDLLEKASKMPFEKIQNKFAQYDGDLRKVARYIKQYKIY